MLIGTVFYFTLDGYRKPDMDYAVEPDYAGKLSFAWKNEYVQWVSVSDPTDIRWFLNGVQVSEPSWRKE